MSAAVVSHASNNASLPLAGVKIIDLSNVLAGPLATYILALLGADVLKIERPGSGDLSRKMGADAALSKAFMGTSFLSTNANKRSMTLNLQAEEGKQVLKRLAEKADVVFENYRPGTMNKLGLGYEELKKLNPKLIYCAVSGFGQEGPLSLRPAYDQIIQGFSGIMDLTGKPGDGPTRVGYTVCDASSAINAALAVLAALLRVRATGQGAMIDVSMLDTTLTLGSWLISSFMNGGAIPHPMGNQNHSAVPSGSFPTKDGLLNLTCNEQSQFESFCDAIGMPELKTDPLWADRQDRLKRRADFHKIVEPVLMTRTASEWEEHFYKKGVPCGKIYSIPEIMGHPQLDARKFITEFAQIPGTERSAKVPGLGFSFKGEDLSPKNPPPKLGQDTEDVLNGLGYSAADVAKMREKKVI